MVAYIWGCLYLGFDFFKCFLHIFIHLCVNLDGCLYLGVKSQKAKWLFIFFGLLIEDGCLLWEGF